MRQLLVIVLLVIGVAVSTSGAMGILRMPDVYLRIQSSSKSVTLGALPVLLALVIAEGPLTPYGGRALIIAVLLLVMNPVASHALAGAAYKAGIPMWSGAVVDQPAEPEQGAAPPPRDGRPGAGRGPGDRGR